MSKLDVGVGDEFPLDESKNRVEHRHHDWRHHHHPHHDHHGHHDGHHRLPMLLVVAGLAALIVAGKIPITAAYVMIALGAVLMLVMFAARARHIRRLRAQ